MALNVDLRILTQPGATGNETLSLAANFDPKAIILWAAPLAAAGTGAHAQFGMGWGTYRSSTVAHRFVVVNSEDAVTTGFTRRETGNDALLVLLLATDAISRDLEIDLVSMQSGATSQVVINWVNLHTTASVKINCLILGGSDITDALAFDFTKTTGVSTQDVTVASGFGQPDLLFCASAARSFGGIGTTASMNFGFGKKGEAGRCLLYSSLNGNTNMFVAMSQRSNLIERNGVVGAGGFTEESSFALNTDPATNWPTDGFQIDYTTQAAFAEPAICLALKGTFTVTTGNGTAPTAGGLPVVQDLNHGSVPKLGFLFGWCLAAATAVDIASADLGALFVGAGDGTVECVAGIMDDDGLGTSDCNRFWSDAKVVINYTEAPTIQSEADGSISGNNFRLSWNDIDTVAREYQWLTLGDAVAGGVTVTPGTASLTIVRFAPTVLTPRLVTPGVASLITTRFAPLVSVGVRIVPVTASLTLATFAPTILTPRLVTPGTVALVTARFAPTVSVGVRVVPGTAALVLTFFAPTVTGDVVVEVGGSQWLVILRHRGSR